jgi:hypothetical protein
MWLVCDHCKSFVIFSACFAPERDLGWLEGKSISIEYRDAEGQADRLPALAAELVALNVDVIVTVDTPPTQAACENLPPTLSQTTLTSSAVCLCIETSLVKAEPQTAKVPIRMRGTVKFRTAASNYVRHPPEALS